MTRAPGKPADRFASARAEQELRNQLELEQARSAALQRELDTVQASEAFRIGHAFVIALNKRLIWRPTAIGRRAVRALTRRPAAGAPSQRARASSKRPVKSRESNAALFVAWGADDERMAQYVERVERLTAILVDITPIFLVDSTAIGALRERDYSCEYVISLREWSRHRPAYDWAAYATERVASVRRRHRPRIVVLLGDEETSSALDQGVLNVLLLPAGGRGAGGQGGAPSGGRPSGGQGSGG